MKGFWVSLQMLAEELIQTPGQFLLYMILVFLLLILLGALIAYFIACAIHRNTQLTGLMWVGVTFNAWPDQSRGDQCVKLDCGEFLIGMQDPAEIENGRLDPKPGFLDKARARRYDVGTILGRYCAAYKSAGCAADPSGRLLDALLDRTDFRMALGVVYRKSRSAELLHEGEAEGKSDGNRLSVYLDFYRDDHEENGSSQEAMRNAAQIFETATGCPVKNIRITLTGGESRGVS